MSRFPIPSGTAITPDLRPAWLECRALGVGASEVADLCGFGYRSPLELYLRKTGAMPAVAETEAMRIGTLCEPVVRDLFERRSDLWIAREQVFFHHDAVPGLFATVDAEEEEGDLVEFKTVGFRAAREWGPDGTNEVPYHYLLQAHAQMIAADRREVSVAALMGTELRVYRVGYSDRVGDAIRREVDGFLGRLDRREPPEPSRPGDAAVLPYLHPGAEGEVELSALQKADAREFFELGERIGELTRRRDLFKARLDAAMAGGRSADIGGGRTLYRRVQHQAEGVRTTQLAAKSWTVFSVRGAKGDGHGDGE